MLYPRDLNVRASRKTISERTSYYQIRLAFHSLPQVIRRCCTTHRFGPPFRFRGTSTCPRQAHLASGLYCTVVGRPIKTRFPYAFALFALRQAMQNKSLAHSSIGTPLHAQPYILSIRLCRNYKASQTKCTAGFVLRFLVGKWFQVLFQRPHRPAFHLSLTVLVHYRSRKVFSLSR